MSGVWSISAQGAQGNPSDATLGLSPRFTGDEILSRLSHIVRCSTGTARRIIKPFGFQS